MVVNLLMVFLLLNSCHSGSKGVHHTELLNEMSTHVNHQRFKMSYMTYSASLKTQYF